MSRRFIALEDRPSGWVEVEQREDGRIVIERDPEAPTVTVRDMDLPGRSLTREEFEREFGHLPTDGEG